MISSSNAGSWQITKWNYVSSLQTILINDIYVAYEHPKPTISKKRITDNHLNIVSLQLMKKMSGTFGANVVSMICLHLNYFLCLCFITQGASWHIWDYRVQANSICTWSRIQWYNSARSFEPLYPLFFTHHGEYFTIII